jgi:flagellar hook assembly protein FlgD
VVDAGQPAATPAISVEAGPAKTELAGVYPNPVRSEASVVFSLSHEGAVDLSVYDVRGARVRTLRNGAFPAGRYTVSWDGRDDAGRRLGGGMYFVRLSAAGYARTMKTAIMP